MENLMMDPVAIAIFAGVFALWTQTTLGPKPPEPQKDSLSTEAELLIALGKILNKDQKS